jgi:hypothetical protein
MNEKYWRQDPEKAGIYVKNPYTTKTWWYVDSDLYSVMKILYI